jgi:hypothetical protein
LNVVPSLSRSSRIRGILKSEYLFDRTPEVLESLWGFLGLPGWEPKTLAPCLEGFYPAMNPISRERIRTYFEPHNRRLYEYLGVDFGW